MLTGFARSGPAVVRNVHPDAEQFGSAGAPMRACSSPFDFSGITLTPPIEIFSGTLDIMVGAKKVRLVEVLPFPRRTTRWST